MAQVKIEMTDDGEVISEVKIEVIEDGEVMSEVKSEESDDDEVTDDDGERSELPESEVSELLEEKLNSTAIGSIRAKKAGLGSSFSTQNNSYCGVLNCPSTTASCKELWFFKLPLHSHEPERRRQWLEKIRRPDVQTCHRLLVCERHFDPKDMGGGNIGIGRHMSKKYLKKGVIPILHLPTTNKKIQRSLHQTRPKHVYQRIHQKVNVTLGNEEPSKSDIQNDYTLKKRKSRKEVLETTITEIEVESSLTKIRRALTEIKQKENEELLLLSTLCNKLAIGELDTCIKLKQKFKNEPYGYSKYSDECTTIIFEMYCAYPQNYEVLQDIIGLPPQSALKSFLPSSEGLTRICMESLVDKISLINPIQKYGILCIEIVNITPHAYYDYERDIINGVDKQTAPFRFAIIAMARGISADWHQIVSVYFFHNITDTTFHEYRSWANSVMLSLHTIGIYIIAVVTSTDDFFVEAYSINESTIELLSSKKYYFLRNNKKVWHIFDPLHLILCLYEELQDNLFVFKDNCTAEWMHIKEFYLRDKEREVSFSDRSCTILPEGSQHDKLESVAELILNETIAAGISAFVDKEIVSEEAGHTANFLKILGESFKFVYPNAMYARPSQKVPKKKPRKTLNSEKKLNKSILNKHLKFFKHLKSFPKNGENKNEKFIKCSVSSFRSILSIIEETKILQLSSSLDAAEIIRNFNLDLLVKFIDMMKLKNTKSLTSELLIETIHESLIQNESQIKMKAFSDYADKLINLERFNREERNMSMVMKDHLKYISDYSAFTCDDGNSLMYISTYLLEKMYQQFRNVVSTRIKLMNSCVHYQHPASGFTGSVIIPEDEFIELVIKMDTVFMNYWRKAMLCGKWFPILQEEMSKAIADIRYSLELASLDFIRDLFIHLRIYHVVQYNNNLFERTDIEVHELVVKRLEGYKLEYKRVQLPCLDYRRNPEYT